MDFKLRSAGKRRQRQKKRSVNRDLISSLPDVILSHILSFCSTKDAAKTSILSRRWRYSWISIPNLDFDDQLPRAYSAVDADLFTESVNRVLHRRDEAIKSFSLQVGNPHMSIEDINQLIFAAIRHNFEEFMLECHICVAQLPGNLYSCRTIKNLKLHGSIFLNIPDSASFPNLKILTLEDLLDADDNSIARIIYFSPFLEQLSITTCCPDNVMNLHIQSSSLKSLSIHVWNRDDEIPPIHRDTYTITIDTPNLDFLDFDDHAYDVYTD